MANSKTIDAISKGPYQWGIVPDDEHQKEWLDKHFGFGSGPVHLIGLPQHPKSVVGSDPERPEHMVTLCMTGSLGWTKQQAADFALYPGRAVKVRLVEVPAKKKGMVSRGK